MHKPAARKLNVSLSCLQLDEGDVVGHIIIDLEQSRRIAAAAAMHSHSQGQSSRHASDQVVTSTPSRQAQPERERERERSKNDFAARDRPSPVRPTPAPCALCVRLSGWGRVGHIHPGKCLVGGLPS